MKRSTDRIPTTHAGSLSRPVDLLETAASRAGVGPSTMRTLDLASRMSDIPR